MRDILYSLNQRIPDQHQPISRQFLIEKSSSSIRTRSGMDICQEIIRKEESRSAEESVEEPSKPMTMMFQKVEAGKQVAESLVKIKKERDTI